MPQLLGSEGESQQLHSGAMTMTDASLDRSSHWVYDQEKYKNKTFSKVYAT